MSISDLSDTIIAKSDQLNADDLIGADKVLIITGVSRSVDDSISINYQGDTGRPWKPSKGMRRVLIFAWGKDGNQWIGRSVRVYNEPSVKWAGKEAGGIRINAMSDIDRPIKINITLARNKKQEINIAVLQHQQKPYWPDDKFNLKLPSITEAIVNGTVTTEQAINKTEVKALLTDEQKALIRDSVPSENVIDDSLNVQDSDFDD